jgi:adenylyltransferase/sulfurtransferase
LIGTLQATEALKLILGLGEPLIARLLLVDTLAMRFRTIGVDRDPECPACGTREIDRLADYDAFCAGGSLAAAGAGQRPAKGPGVITPAELSSSLNRGEPIVVIDVREPYEWQLGRIPTARLIPLATLRAAVPSLDREARVVVYCHHGSRSAAAAQALVGAGFSNVRNLVGGIDRWSLEVDPGVRRY